MSRVFLLFATLSICLSCSRPESVETFISKSDVNEQGEYEFPVDFYDSTATYSLSFFARRDISFHKRGRYPDSRLVVSWIDPSGEQRLQDTVYMNMGTSRGVMSQYRSGVTVPAWGIWTIKVEISEPGPRFRGLGLVCNWNGTR